MKKATKKLSLGIRQKVLLVLLSVLLSALSLSGWFALQQEKENIIQETNQRGTDISRFVAKSLAYSVVGYDYHTIQLLLDEIIRSEEISYAQVANKRGNTMGIAGAIQSTADTPVNFFNEKIRLDGDVVGELTLGLSSEKVIKRLEANKLSLITREAIIIILIAVGEFLALSYIIIRPVRLISSSLDNSVNDDGVIKTNIPLDSGDEFGQLAHKFNELSHELNSANTKLQTKIEAADSRLRETNEQLLLQQENLKQVNAELRHISITDPLTGLYNRRHFEDLITTDVNLSLRHGDENSLLIIDIDHFKSINDRYGHFSGDIALKVVADALRNNLRKTDVVCRIGGEEFAVLCKRANKEQALLIAEKLRNATSAKKINLGDTTITITISVGGASIPDARNTRSVDELYRYADSALYFSKESGRDRYTHYDDLTDDELKSISG